MAVAIGAAVTTAATAASQMSGGGGGSAGGAGGGGGGLNPMQAQFTNSVKLNEGPKFGGSKEPQISNPDMPLNNKAPAPEKAASKWTINATPTQAVGDEQAKQDANSIWADRLNKYLDYSTRQLG